LPGANPKNGEIAEANRDQVEEAVEQYFLENYKTEVKVQNIVSAKDGVSVFVESIGKPHFYSLAIVPIDAVNEVVGVDKVWYLQGEIEGVINSSLYVIAFQEEFDNLDKYREDIANKYSLRGIKMEVIAKTAGNGYNAL